MDRFDLYELFVQSPRHVAMFLRAVHGAGPLVLREDFCGTAALSRRWVADLRKDGEHPRAVAVDLDAETIVRAGAEAERAGGGGRSLAGPSQHPRPRRADLVGYLRRARARLAAGLLQIRAGPGYSPANSRRAVRTSSPRP